MKYFILLFLSFTIYSISSAQPQWNNWYFSGGNGMDFSNGDPISIAGEVYAEEGVSVISDKNGALLFYTDGRFVWNKLHEMMPNALDLNGGALGSSTQGSVIVPKTEDGLEYYIFTTDEEGRGNGLQYSIVDMRLDGGKGDVTVKNIPLLAPTSEKVTAVLSCDKKSYWIITHKFGSADFYAFHADKDGVNTIPVISTSGTFIPNTIATMAGYLKASPDGKKIAAAHHSVGIELADFDNSTGVLSNIISIWDKPVPGACYGVEFSPNSSLLYASVNFYRNAGDPNLYSGIFQFNVTLSDQAAIVASAIKVAATPFPNLKGALQRAPNGKMYITNYTKDYLSIIHSPDIIGTACNFEESGFALNNTAELCLPNFIANYYGTKDSFTATASGGYCVNTPVQFNYNRREDAVSLRWNFDDPSSGAENSSDEVFPTHYFSAARTYKVQLIRYGRCENDTMIKEITVGDMSVNLGTDKSICEQNPVLLDPKAGASNTYLWTDGSISPTYMATVAGIYWVQVTNTINGCVSRDSIELTLPPGGHCTLFIPSGFTPDGNGRNDYFKALGTGQVDVLSMKVFNRTGGLIFSSNDKNIGWDGKFRGINQPGGLYVYMIHYKEINSTEMKLLKGTLMLIR